MKRLMIIACASLLLCISPLVASAAHAAPLKVVTSISILADMVRQITGSNAEVTSLVPPDGDAHSFEPSPADAKALAQADLVIVNGLALESWTQRLIDASGYNGSVIVASKGVTPRLLTEEEAAREHEDEHEAHENHHGEYDPHAWQDLSNGKLYVGNIEAALEKAEVAVVVLDVSQPISEQDVRIIDMVLEAGRALVLAFNKWDLLGTPDMEDVDRRRYLEREIEQDLAHVAWAPRVNISAKTGRHLEKLVPALETALASWDQRIPTGKFNAFLSELVAEHPHPVRGGKQPRILFGTQAATRPPTFVLFTTGFLDPGYRRFIQRRLRELFGFEGTPIVVSMRVRERRKR